MPCGQFPANRLNEPKSQSDIASRPLPKSPVSSSQYDVVPQMIIRSPNVRPGEFAIGDAKRLLQQYLPRAEVYPQQSVQPATRHPSTWAQQAPRRLGTTRTRTDADGSRAIRKGRFQRPVPQLRRQKLQS